MTDKMADATTDAATPADFSTFDAKVVTNLLGPGPITGRPRSYDRPDEPDGWPEDFERVEFLYRGLARLLRERGGTAEDAKSIRQDLQAGRLRAAVALPHGPLWELEPSRFQGEDSRGLWWTARAVVHVYTGPRRGSLEGDIYLTAAPEPEAAPEPVKLTSGAEAQCRTWLNGQVLASPDLRPKPRADFEAEAKGLFPGLSSRAFERAWGVETKGTAWAEAGRPRKIPAQNPHTKIAAPE